MKINEISNVVRHPAMKRKDDFDNLLMSDNQDDIIAFILDDNNTQERRLALLKRLDLMLGNPQESYSEEDLGDFMHDQGDWKDNLHNALSKVKKGPKWNRQSMSDEEIELQIAKDLKLPPYHLANTIYAISALVMGVQNAKKALSTLLANSNFLILTISNNRLTNTSILDIIRA